LVTCWRLSIAAWVSASARIGTIDFLLYPLILPHQGFGFASLILVRYRKLGARL
jgi:hypothetical protein